MKWALTDFEKISAAHGMREDERLRSPLPNQGHFLGNLLKKAETLAMSYQSLNIVKFTFLNRFYSLLPKSSN